MTFRSFGAADAGWLSTLDCSDGSETQDLVQSFLRTAALDCLYYEIDTELNWIRAKLIIDYAAYRFERHEVEGALETLRRGCDLTGAYRIGAIMHTVGRDA